MPCIPSSRALLNHTWLGGSPPLSAPSPTEPNREQTQGDPTPSLTPDRSQHGWEPWERGKETLAAPRGTWASLLPGDHPLRRRAREQPAGRAGRAARFSAGGAAGLTSEVATSRPGPAGTPRAAPGPAAATLLSPAGQGALVWGQHPPSFPLRLQETSRRGVT